MAEANENAKPLTSPPCDKIRGTLAKPRNRRKELDTVMEILRAGLTPSADNLPPIEFTDNYPAILPNAEPHSCCDFLMEIFGVKHRVVKRLKL